METISHYEAIGAHSQAKQFLCLLVFLLFSSAGFAADAKRGQALYASCTACHGEDAAGQQSMNAPSLVNQTDWYLVKQLNNFKAGIRGSHKDDSIGAQMRSMAAQLKSPQDVDDVVAFIKRKPAKSTTATLKGDKRSGKQYYDMVCGGCHGPKAEGNDILQAPALAGVDDWYLVRQFAGFRAGLRGSHPEDKSGAQMQAMVKALPNDKVVNDVVSYVRSLEK